MSHEILLINIISATIGALIIYYYFKHILNFSITKKSLIIFTIIFGILNGFISSRYITSPLKPIILFVVSVIIIKLLFKPTFLQSLLSFALYTICIAIGNSIIPIIAKIFKLDYSVNTMQNNILLLFVGNLFVNTIAYVVFISIKPLKQYMAVVNKNKFVSLLTITTILVVFSSLLLYYYIIPYDFKLYLYLAIITTSYCIFAILIWFNALKKAMTDEDIAQQKFYNESLRCTLFELRRFKHDWGNCLTVINSMLKMNKIDDLKQYVSELIAQGTEFGGTEIYNIKNAGLFGIISSKINQAREMGVNVNISVIGEVENIHGIKVSELCEVVGIFLDNAIEEADKGPKSIAVNIQNDDNDQITISISNKCVDVPNLSMIDKEGYSSKGPNRGMGLAIAKKILSKYNNILHTTTFENNVFTQTIEILPRKGS